MGVLAPQGVREGTSWGANFVYFLFWGLCDY